MLLNKLKSHQINPLTEPNNPQLAEAADKPASNLENIVASGDTDFPEENATPETNAITELDASQVLSKVQEQAPFDTAPAHQPQPVVDPFTSMAIDQLQDNETAPGSKQPFSFEHGIPAGEIYAKHELVNAKRREEYASPADKSPYDPRLLDPQTDEQAVERSIANKPCREDLNLIPQKLKRFIKLFYLHPSLWEAKTLQYMFKAYEKGMSINAIHDKVGAPSRNFADASGNQIPTFKSIRPELGNLRMIDVYATLATCIYMTAASKSGKIAAAEQKLIDGVQLREIDQRGIQYGEVSATTFVDLIYYDYIFPQSLGHKGLAEMLERYDEGMSSGNIRKLYDSVIVNFRKRWKQKAGVNRSLQAKTSTNADKILRRLDAAMSEHMAILEAGNRRFLLMEWHEELPKSLPGLNSIAHELAPNDMKLFLSKFLEVFDTALPFDRNFIKAIRQEIGVKRQIAIGQASILKSDDLQPDPFAQ